MNKELLILLEKEKVLNVDEATRILGARHKVYQLVDGGEIVPVVHEGTGHYKLPTTDDGEAHFAIISKYYPKCVVSGPTALTLYGLADEYIDKIDVDISNKTNLKNKLFNIHRISPHKLNGIVCRSFEEQGVSLVIKTYGPERILHEAFKYYRFSDSFYKVLKRYREKYLNKKSPAQQYEDIISYNKKIGIIIVNFLKMDDVNE
jgi:hypothetical protein